MAIDMPLIFPSDKAKYFLFQDLTRFLKIRSDLPVGLDIGWSERSATINRHR
jgi:hypothetical protein